MNYHTKVSFIKSAIRICGFSLCLINFLIGIILLILAEIIGIFEEL